MWDILPHLQSLRRFFSRMLNSLAPPVRRVHRHHYLHRCVWRDARSGRHYRSIVRGNEAWPQVTAVRGREGKMGQLKAAQEVTPGLRGRVRGPERGNLQSACGWEQENCKVSPWLLTPFLWWRWSLKRKWRSQGGSKGKWQAATLGIPPFWQ